jgi:hypothetical protein
MNKKKRPLVFHPSTVSAYIPVYLSHGSLFMKCVSPSSCNNWLATALAKVFPTFSPFFFTQSVKDISTKKIII